MGVVADGDLSGPVDALRKMLAASARFQKLVQAANATEALLKIVAFGEDADIVRPFGAVDINDSPGEMLSINGPRPAGKLSLTIEIPWQWNGVVTTQSTTKIFTISALAGLPDDYLNGQILLIRSGAQIGQVSEIGGFIGASGQVTLATDLPGLPGVGVSLEIEPSTFSDGMIVLMNNIAQIRSELIALSGAQTGYLILNSIRLGNYGRPACEQGEPLSLGANLDIQFGL